MVELVSAKSCADGLQGLLPGIGACDRYSCVRVAAYVVDLLSCDDVVHEVSDSVDCCDADGALLRTFALARSETPLQEGGHLVQVSGDRVNTLDEFLNGLVLHVKLWWRRWWWWHVFLSAGCPRWALLVSALIFFVAHSLC
eukprot:6490917-Amphidinium_carterae.1